MSLVIGSHLGGQMLTMLKAILELRPHKVPIDILMLEPIFGPFEIQADFICLPPLQLYLSHQELGFQGNITNLLHINIFIFFTYRTKLLEKNHYSSSSIHV